MEIIDMFDPDYTEQPEMMGEMLDEVMEILYQDFGDTLLGDADIERF